MVKVEPGVNKAPIFSAIVHLLGFTLMSVSSWQTSCVLIPRGCSRPCGTKTLASTLLFLPVCLSVVPARCLLHLPPLSSFAHIFKLFCWPLMVMMSTSISMSMAALTTARATH